MSESTFGAHTASWHRACVQRARARARSPAGECFASGARAARERRRAHSDPNHRTAALSLAAAAPHCSVIRVTLASPEHAAHAAAALSVDAELQAGRAARRVSCAGAELTADVRAADLRLLRIAGAAYFDMLGVVLRTLREFA